MGTWCLLILKLAQTLSYTVRSSIHFESNSITERSFTVYKWIGMSFVCFFCSFEKSLSYNDKAVFPPRMNLHSVFAIEHPCRYSRSRPVSNFWIVCRFLSVCDDEVSLRGPGWTDRHGTMQSKHRDGSLTGWVCVWCVGKALCALCSLERYIALYAVSQ